MPRRGEKHLVQCRCILQQFRSRPSPPFHQFVVFSEIDENDEVVPKFSQCNNCGIVHKVVGICKSEVVQGQEDLRTLVTIDELKLGLPEQLSKLLQNYDLDLATWEQAKFIIEQQFWGDVIILVREKLGDHCQGKLVRILGDSLFKIESFIVQETL